MKRCGSENTEARITRTISQDNRHVCKTIERSGHRRFTERVRLFEPGEIAGMLVRAGVTIRHRFGDYDGHVLTPASARTILVGQVA